jgi:nicotinamidase-related amidase
MKNDHIRCGLFAILIFLVSLPAAAPARAISSPAAPPDTALLVIDIQNFYFPGGRLPLTGPEAAARNAGRLLAAFRSKKWPVIHVQHLPADVAAYKAGETDAAYAISPAVAPLAGEAVVGKHFANAFRDTGLARRLKALGVKKLVICGMQTHMCVEATVRAGADLGYAVTLVGDACATRSLAINGRELPAETVHAAVLAILNGSYARVADVATLLDEWK